MCRRELRCWNCDRDFEWSCVADCRPWDGESPGYRFGMTWDTQKLHEHWFHESLRKFLEYRRHAFPLVVVGRFCVVGGAFRQMQREEGRINTLKFTSERGTPPAVSSVLPHILASCSPTVSSVQPLRSMFAAGGHEARDQNFVGSLLWPNPQRDCNTHAPHHYDTAMFSNFRVFQLSAKSCPYTHPKGSGNSVPNRAPNRRRNNQVVLAYEPSESGCRAWAPNVRIACN